MADIGNAHMSRDMFEKISIAIIDFTDKYKYKQESLKLYTLYPDRVCVFFVF